MNGSEKCLRQNTDKRLNEIQAITQMPVYIVSREMMENIRRADLLCCLHKHTHTQHFLATTKFFFRQKNETEIYMKN